MIQCIALRKQYGDLLAVHDLDLEIAPGEVFGFLGPNGAGKTTTIRLLMGLLFPGGGRASIGGLDCWRDPVQVKRLVGYLPGELSLDPNLTGGQILTYFANLRGSVDPAYVERLVSRLDLDTSRRFRHYSHGNKQKVGLIQAFMHRPRVLILDEPTSGLDPLNQHEFQQMVFEARAEGRTVVLSSHVLSEVESSCDRVAIIRDGRLVRIGGVAELKDIRHHHIGLTFATTPPLEAFRGLNGLERVDLAPDGVTLRLVLQGSVDDLIKLAGQYPVVNIVSEEPSLEDIFLRYYRDDDAPAATGSRDVVA